MAMNKIYKKCPKCNSSNIIKILYGEPTYEHYLESEKGNLILKGCCMPADIDIPKYHCKDCGYEYNTKRKY